VLDSIIIIIMADNYNICYHNLPILSMRDTEMKDTPTHSPIHRKFQAQSQATPDTNTSQNNSVVLMMKCGQRACIRRKSDVSRLKGALRSAR
jgi:hypothetical protein